MAVLAPRRREPGQHAESDACLAAAVLRGFKDTRGPMVLCLAGHWAIGMPVAYTAAFSFGLGTDGIWAGLAVGVAATAVLLSARLGVRRPSFVST